jgi:predicted Zn-dependent protease
VLLSLCCAFRPLENTPLSGEISIERESEITAEIHRKLRGQAEFVTDPVLLAYVNRIGQRIVRVTEPQPFIYRFSVLEADELNAFTIGGGYVYISSGVLAQAGDVTELAGVLAHEIAHVRLRHVAKAQENQGLVTLASLAAAAAVVLAGGDPRLLVITEGINVSMQLKHSREHEAEADR